MQLTVQLKLTPTAAQAETLAATMRQANTACGWLSERAWQTKTFRQFDLHKLAYRESRAEVIRPYADRVEVVVSHGLDLQSPSL